MNKLIVILGPTASGKSELAVKLAKKFNGEVVSADSRQVYKGMNLGTGKISKREMKGIPHYLLDVASPKRKYTVARFKKQALIAIKKIQKKDKVPILCGGTAFYIQAVVDGLIIPKVKPDWKLRKELEKETSQEIFQQLKKLDPQRAKTIEPKNKRRLIRALEIVIKTKKPVPMIKKEKPKFQVLLIGTKKPSEELKKLITKRLVKRIKKGMINEARRLKKTGVSWKRMESFGLEYRWMAFYLQNKIILKQMLEKIQKDSEKFAKRQMTWIKKDKRIKWIENYGQAEKLIKDFLN